MAKKSESARRSENSAAPDEPNSISTNSALPKPSAQRGSNEDRPTLFDDGQHCCQALDGLIKRQIEWPTSTASNRDVNRLVNQDAVLLLDEAGPFGMSLL